MSVGGDNWFSIEERSDGDGSLRLLLTGELDLATADLLEARVREACERGRVMLDLRQLEFIDARGIRALLKAMASARRDGWQLEIGREVRDQVRRVIDAVEVGPALWG